MASIARHALNDNVREASVGDCDVFQTVKCSPGLDCWDYIFI